MKILKTICKAAKILQKIQAVKSEYSVKLLKIYRLVTVLVLLINNR